MQTTALRWRDGAWQTVGGTWPAAAGLVLVCGSGALLRDPAVRSTLRERLPAAVMVGCSTAGEILGPTVGDDGAVALAVTFASTTVASALQRIEAPTESEAAGHALAQQLAARDGLRHVLVFSDGLLVNGAALAAGLRVGLPAGVSASGGLAGDGSRFAETTVLHGDEAASGLVAAVGFYGDALDVRCGSAGGWEPFGPHRLVTRAGKNILFELDGQPALALYKKYLGDRAAGLPATGLLFPLELLPAQDGEPSVVRTILAVDEATQSLTFAGDVPTGRYVRLMTSTIDKLIWGAEAAVGVATANGPNSTSGGSAELALLVSCVGRRLLLGQRVEEEVEAVLSALGDPAGVIGFYSYGEISPAGLQHGCELHNQTMTLTTLAERIP